MKKVSFTVLSITLAGLLVSQLSFAQTSTDTTTVTKGKSTTTETTVTTPAPARPTYDQATLMKMSKTLCVDGFDAKVGNDNKNICAGLATPPDISYSCLWTKKGEGTYPSTEQGPCNLDSAVHRDGIVIAKADYKSSPPLSYGTRVECCYRAAVGQSTSSTTTETVKKK